MPRAVCTTSSASIIFYHCWLWQKRCNGRPVFNILMENLWMFIKSAFVFALKVLSSIAQVIQLSETLRLLAKKCNDAPCGLFVVNTSSVCVWLLLHAHCGHTIAMLGLVGPSARDRFTPHRETRLETRTQTRVFFHDDDDSKKPTTTPQTFHMIRVNNNEECQWVYSPFYMCVSFVDLLQDPQLSLIQMDVNFHPCWT